MYKCQQRQASGVTGSLRYSIIKSTAAQRSSTDATAVIIAIFLEFNNKLSFELQCLLTNKAIARKKRDYYKRRY